jgi:hypothetical protein
MGYVAQVYQHSCNYVLLLQHVTALFKTIFSEEQPFKHSVGYLPVIKTWLSWDFSGSHGSDYRLLATFPRRFCRYSHV